MMCCEYYACYCSYVLLLYHARCGDIMYIFIDVLFAFVFGLS